MFAWLAATPFAKSIVLAPENAACGVLSPGVPASVPATFTTTRVVSVAAPTSPWNVMAAASSRPIASNDLILIFTLLPPIEHGCGSPPDSDRCPLHPGQLPARTDRYRHRPGRLH